MNTPRHLFHPRHWPTWLGLALLRLLVALPQAARMWIGRRIGRALMPLLGRRVHITAVNIGLAFPELSPAAQAERVREHIESQSLGLIELGIAWWGSDREIARLTDIHGLDNLTAPLDAGHGVVLLSAHFAPLDLSVRALGLRLPFDFTYRPHQNPVLDHLLRRHRERNDKHHIPRDDMRAFIKALKGGRAVWYASDQNFGHKNSAFVDFFGVPAATNTALSRIVKLGDARVVPYFYRRRSDDRGYDIEVLPALSDFPGADPVADAARINTLIEDAVRKAPEQYYWSHRRYKDRPDNEPRFY
ncbi:MAG: LpxL/LpxP family Kdo(2)-lipid IV(A) lauroyl/palmitoleoyl acyltransferase [Gammaproteobacteria bacterium]|nr:LpxL/LpxP family Kdo(2)-lipid IV(A) lauroyl/palmitoleoyl acyltransferase [Gammaproteobacteria bacterium]